MAKQRAAAREAGAAPWALAAACALAAASALWALFQWTELHVARSGGESFCGFGGGDTCARVWDSPLAGQIQGLTGPAGGGLGPGLVPGGFRLPADRTHAPCVGSAGGASSRGGGLARRCGAISVMGLAAGLAWEGALCTTCLLTHTLVLAYAAVVLAGGLKLGPGVRSGGLALAGVAAGFVVLLIPGLRTPPAPSLHSGVELLAGSDPTETADPLGRFLESSRPMRARPSPPPWRCTGQARMCRRASPGRCSAIAARRSASPSSPTRSAGTVRRSTTRSPRSAGAPRRAPSPWSRGTSRWTASATRTSRAVRGTGFGVWPHGPRSAPRETREPSRSRARSSRTSRASTWTRSTGPPPPLLSEDSLRSCVADPSTEARLQDDIAWAMEHGIRGTPLVLVNGRQAAPYPPLLYALVLAGGDADHPASTPCPRPRTTPTPATTTRRRGATSQSPPTGRGEATAAPGVRSGRTRRHGDSPTG